MSTKITDNYFDFGNRKYFRGNAHLVKIGTFGEKKDPAGSKSYIDPQGTVKAEHLAPRIKTGTTVDINWNETTKASFEENGIVKFFGINGEIESNGTYEKAKSADLKLINFFIEEGPLTRMLNTDATIARNELADEGNDGRIISEIWVVMVASLAEHFSMYGSKSISAKAYGQEVKVTVSGGKSGSQSVTFSTGTTFAFKTHKVKKWTDKKTEIEDMEADYYGMS
jgi:hypothetical protein